MPYISIERCKINLNYKMVKLTLSLWSSGRKQNITRVLFITFLITEFFYLNNEKSRLFQTLPRTVRL